LQTVQTVSSIVVVSQSAEEAEKGDGRYSCNITQRNPQLKRSPRSIKIPQNAAPNSLESKAHNAYQH